MDEQIHILQHNLIKSNALHKIVKNKQ